MNLSKIKSTLFDALNESGKILKKTLNERRIVEKKSALNLVTETDKSSEKQILRIIRRAFPDHSILTEESPPSGSSASRWIIDPLDGTTNFAHTFPAACISIAFEHEGEVLAGGVFDPFRSELFFAEKGKGAFLNSKRIRVSKNPTLIDSLLCTGFPYDRREKIDEYLPVFRDFIVRVQGIRRMGAAALDLCYVACGRFDGYWEVKLNPWDKAAGMLIIKEAGGRVTNFSGAPLTLEDRQNLATNGLIHSEMLSVFKPYQHVGNTR